MPVEGMIFCIRIRANPMVHLSPNRRALLWTVLAAVVALLCLLGFRGYLGSDLLLNFANMFYC